MHLRRLLGLTKLSRGQLRSAFGDRSLNFRQLFLLLCHRQQVPHDFIVACEAVHLFLLRPK